MKRYASGAVALALASALPAFAGGHEGKIKWEKDPAKGFQRAKVEGLPAMVFFTADW